MRQGRRDAENAYVDAEKSRRLNNYGNVTRSRYLAGEFSAVRIWPRILICVVVVQSNSQLSACRPENGMDRGELTNATSDPK